MKMTIAMAAIALSTVGTPAAECKDGICAPPSAEETPCTVLSPVPECAVEPIRPAQRLNSLDGKTVALVGGSFMANVTHLELKRLMLAEYPTAKVYVLGEIGSAGPYPRPGVVRREKDEFQRKLKEFKIDAVVSGNGGCGLCTPKETGSCIAAEALGIPSVMIAAPGFVKQAKSTAAAVGLHELHIAEYPGAFASHTQEELLTNTRKVLWPQVKAGLMGAKGVRQATPGSRTPDVDGRISGTHAEIQRIFLDSGWTDGLPIIPPTEKAVAEFLRFTDLPPSRSLGAIPLAQRVVTGDPSRNKVLTVPGGSFATVKIELPKAWDALMSERGYKPLAEFRLKTSLKPDEQHETWSPIRRRDAPEVPPQRPRFAAPKQEK